MAAEEGATTTTAEAAGTGRRTIPRVVAQRAIMAAVVVETEVTTEADADAELTTATEMEAVVLARHYQSQRMQTKGNVTYVAWMTRC